MGLKEEPAKAEELLDEFSGTEGHISASGLRGANSDSCHVGDEEISGYKNQNLAKNNLGMQFLRKNLVIA